MKYLAIIALFLLAGYVIAPAYGQPANGQKDSGKATTGSAMQCKDGGMKGGDSCCKDGHSGMMGHDGMCKDGGKDGCMMGHDGGCCRDDGMMMGRGGMNGCPAHGMMMNCGPRPCAQMVFRCIFGTLFLIAIILFILMEWYWLRLLMAKNKAAKEAAKAPKA
jgi:hypothetical protein